MSWKLPFVILFVVIALVKVVVVNRQPIYRPLLVVLFAIIAKGIIWTAIGIFNGNRGVIAVLNINLTWYFLFSLFMILIDNIRMYKRLLTTLLFASTFIVVFDLIYIFMALGFIPYFDTSFLYSPSEFNFSIYSGAGFSYLSANNITVLVFVYPFTLSLLFTPNSIGSNKLRIFVLVICLLQIVLAIFSGRRILFLTVLLSPFYIYFFAIFTKKAKRRAFFDRSVQYFLVLSFMFVILLKFLLSSLDFSLTTLSERLFSAFDSDKESIRFVQSEMLFAEFAKSPLIGHGAGAEILNYKRSSKWPWAFEMSYYDDLFKSGLLGFSIFLFFALGIFRSGIRLVRKHNDSLMIGLLSGFLSILIANATNPFLSSFDCFWMIFLPMIYINIKEITKSSNE